MDEIKKITGEIDGIHTENIELGESFLDFASRFASMPGTVILMSGGDNDCSRYHILGAKPWLTFAGRINDMEIKAEDHSFNFKADPFDTLRNILNAYRPYVRHLHDHNIQSPFAAGILGYLSYDLKDSLEELPRTSIDDLYLPHICFFAPSIIVIHDRKEDRTSLFIPERVVSGESVLSKDLEVFRNILASKQPLMENFSGDIDGFRSSFTRSKYINAIKQIKEYIASGHVYQVNLSQRFEMSFRGSAFSLFKTLYKLNPAPFFSYINAGDHIIVSTSPERFLLQSGDRLETRPIKGTIPRGENLDEDKKRGLELKNSGKNDAELSMIVDLLRNDLGKICEAGSVRVAEHKRLEAYKNVFHLVSIVEGILGRDRDAVDIIKATFPGGSITGCPKIRSMEIIDELEPHRRHIYTGSIGYISFHDTMDLSIAIRTATIVNKKIIFSVGGGIVFDSDPSDEYDETMHKGRTLMEVFKGKEEELSSKNYVWINGNIEPIELAKINVTDQGFLFGYGFFETIRVDKGKPQYLKEHISRFNQTWKYLFFERVPDLTWQDIIYQVISGNGLLEETAAVKIVASKGNCEKSFFDFTLIVMAKPYIHRLAEKKEQGLNLVVYPKPRQTPLADYKTLNYLYYLLAGEWAKKKGADEALILNPDDTISETNTANILLIKDKTFIRPVSPHVLSGVMEKVVRELLSNWGYMSESKKLYPEDLFLADQVIITNSLIGAIPVLSIDGKKLKKPTDLWMKINNAVL
ncbi:MAG: aminodeoxychorismate synthase component I [Proteobacteria bacterium]|nr:aminodeoxychorismate synthase component I [Pseudomonadota bacterium]MBU4259907.1 aminodeoxychorismate synthase component I [Pseudomonadota bacterium]MBU4289202.1 aminodeoxychorismate synthase component I [Pseudomonadota bacterium]MBU4414179.1 aminodeoxychorismate synthase component I [Pseudomonadota bacterium]